MFKELHTCASMEPKGCHQQSKLGEATGNCFQNSLLQNKVLLSLWTSRLPAWENKCKFSVGFGVLDFLFSFLPKVLMAEILMRVYCFHSTVLSSPTISLCHPLCATMQDFKRWKWREYAPETCKIHCVLGDSSGQKRWGRAMLQKAFLPPHIFPLVLSAGYLKRRSLYFVTKQSDQLPPTNKACRVWQLFLPVEKIPGLITVETPQFLGFVILQHRSGVVSMEDCVQPSSEIVRVWSCSFLWFLLVPWFSVSFDMSFW